SLVGDHDWTYLTLRFDSGSRTNVEVGPRLGHYGSTATGQAWFSDLHLIELGPPHGAGLVKTNNPQIAILWDKKSTRGRRQFPQTVGSLQIMVGSTRGRTAAAGRP